VGHKLIAIPTRRCTGSFHHHMHPQYTLPITVYMLETMVGLFAWGLTALSAQIGYIAP